MTHLNTVKGSTNSANAIVVFGLSEEGKPQAGLFAQSQAALAKKAARQLGLTALTVTQSDLAAIKAKIPAGRLYANRRSFVPAARRDLHDKLIEFARSGSGGSSQDSDASDLPPAPPAGFPKDADSIAPGHQVIAQASLKDGWWEAIVVARDADMLTLQWRDFPAESPFRMHRCQVALQQEPTTTAG